MGGPAPLSSRNYQWSGRTEARLLRTCPAEDEGVFVATSALYGFGSQQHKPEI